MNEVVEIESIPTKIKYKGIIWIPESKKQCVKVNNVNNNFTTPVERPKHGNRKKPYIVKWIEEKNPKDVFTLDQFYRVYPKLKKDTVGRKRVDKIINGMVASNKIIQLHDDKFVVA